MNSITIVLFALLACASAVDFIQGPSSRSTVVGPDGSAIHAAAPGGHIATATHPGLVARTGPVYAAAPLIARSAPVIAHHGFYAHHAAPLAYAHHGLLY